MARKIWFEELLREYSHETAFGGSSEDLKHRKVLHPMGGLCQFQRGPDLGTISRQDLGV
jgi:hypothetical protein